MEAASLWPPHFFIYIVQSFGQGTLNHRCQYSSRWRLEAVVAQ
jgi:hypothetical protein